MTDFTLSYREVIPDQTLPEKWKEFTLNTGGTQSTLQDIKVPERANGYCYRDSSKHHTRNRFIYWRISNDILELVEQSLDVNLSGNRVRFKFTDTPILDGISIHEYYGSVIILVPTVCSVHRLTFPHPNRIHKQDNILGTHPDLAVPSIFSDISSSDFSEPSTFFVFNSSNTTNSVLPHVAASFLDVSQEEAIFAFAYPSGEQLLVKHSFSGICTCIELKQETKVSRFLSGIAGALRGKSSDGCVVVSMVLHSLGVEIYVIALCRDGNLRIWSCQRGQHIAVSDVLADTADSGKNLIQGAQNHMLRKSVDNADTELTLGVFLSVFSECQFHVLRPSVINGVFKITRLCTLYAAEQDLMDFSLDSSRLWTIWRDPSGTCSVLSACLNSQTRGEWLPAILSPPLDPEFISPDPDIDPKQAYVSYIFHPGRFPLSVISKALSIYRRSAALSDINVGANVLKQRVCVAVETEIQTEVQEYEVSDMEYLDITTRCWSRFYSCCVQYYAASAKPLGLLLLPSVSGVVLLKKSMYSFLRPLDVLEQMMFCPETTTSEQFTNCNQAEFSSESEVVPDLIQLMSILVTLEQQLTESFKFNIEKEMAQLKSPDKVMSDLVIELMVGAENPILSSQFLWSLSQNLSNCNDLYAAMHLLLELLRMDAHRDSEKLYPDLSKENLSLNHLFSSELGVSVVSECLHQQAVVRFSICRNLLLLQNILLERRELDWGILEAIRSVCMPETVVFMQAYYIIMWLSEQPAQPTTLSETTGRRFAPLKLTPVYGLKTKSNRLMTLLELFCMSQGGNLAHTQLRKMFFEEDTLPYWHISMLGYVRQLGKLIWAVSGDLNMGEWLLSSGQHLLLQQYVRLLNRWCEWNNCSRNFLLAVSLLNLGEFYKAQDLFLKASKGIFSERFLAERVPEGATDAVALVNYHLKVINLFELHGARDCAINVARTALSIAESDDPHIATLHSVMFVHHLALGHYEEAYVSLIANPDPLRKEDNLRDLVKTLLDKKMLDALLSFPFVNMEEIFTNIIIARARACDLVYNMFYDFLFSYEVKRGNMRVAATVMYEQAYRLGQHNTIESLELQVKCYLVCINCLNLVEDNLKWVLRPVDEGEGVLEFTVPQPAGTVNKKKEIHKIKSQVKWMNFEDIKREFELANGRLRLARISPQSLANQFNTADELVTQLSSKGIFKSALKLCRVFKLPYDGVVASVTNMCLRLTRNNNPNAWNWLVENDLADMQVVDSSPANVCWNLLEEILEDYEEPKMTHLHKIVVQKLLANRATVPYWVLAYYKINNPAELLRIYIIHGCIQEATNLASQHLWAALGKGREHFGFEKALVACGSQYALPIFWFSKLQAILQTLSETNPKYKQEYQDFQKLLKKYIDLFKLVTADTFQMVKMREQEISIMT